LKSQVPCQRHLCHFGRGLESDAAKWFRLESSVELRHWTEEIWNEINGERTCIEISKDGSAFYWGFRESHHQTIAMPMGNPGYRAIFRRCKGFYDGEP
jgi:hypothetical protein